MGCATLHAALPSVCDSIINFFAMPSTPLLQITLQIQTQHVSTRVDSDVLTTILDQSNYGAEPLDLYRILMLKRVLLLFSSSGTILFVQSKVIANEMRYGNS